MNIILNRLLVTVYLVTIAARCTVEQNTACNGGVKCVLLNECTGLASQIQEGATPQLASLLRNLHCGFENSTPMICCPPQFSQNRTSTDWLADPASLLPNLRTCGIQNNDRIVGGTQADIDEHPWMVLLRYDKPQGWGFYCGGVLISQRYVLTAAHCVAGADIPSNWRLSQVRLGEWNTSTATDCVMDDCAGPVQDIPIERIIPHDQFDSLQDNQHNDIALLRLARPAQLNDFVKPICMPLSADVVNNPFQGATLEVAGWGKTETRSESDVKLKVRVPVVSLERCRSIYKNVPREIINKQICAGAMQGRDSCRGDSGGPLMGMSPTGQNWVVIGVVSYGPTPCGTTGWPGVYTRVGAYVDWILSKLRP